MMASDNYRVRRRWRHKAAATGLCLLVAGLLPVSAAAQAPGGSPLIDWAAVMRSLGQTLQSWQFSVSAPATPPPSATATRPLPTATATRRTTPSATATRTRTSTRTKTATPVRPTRTPTRTATLTRTKTPTTTPRPSATSTPTIDPAQYTPPPPPGELGLGEAQGIPPEQQLASAIIVFPYIVFDGSTDTRIEIVNMSREDQTLQCFYVRQSDCLEIGFSISLTSEQPLSWLASTGARNVLTFSAVPPFDGVGELKCAVDPRRPELAFHNVIQGRAIVYDRATGETVGYGAIGFQRLEPGNFSPVVPLDGFTYEECPERLHFHVLTANSVASSLVLVPCSEDLLTQTPTETAVQFAIVNEFEQVFSSSIRFKCMTTQVFGRFGPLRRATLGTETAHLVVRGVSDPLLGLVIDRFDALGQRQTAVNEPFLEGGAPATIIFP